MNYGCADVNDSEGMHTSAYMLAYVKKSEIASLLEDVSTEDIPKALRLRLSAERTADNAIDMEEREAHLYAEVGFNFRKSPRFMQNFVIQVHVVDGELVANNEGVDFCDETQIGEQSTTYQMNKSTTLAEIYDEIGATKVGVFINQPHFSGNDTINGISFVSGRRDDAPTELHTFRGLSWWRSVGVWRYSTASSH